MILSSRDLERREPACGRDRGLRDSFFFILEKIALVPGRELPEQMDKAHLSRMLNPGWKTGINARWQPGLKGSSVLVITTYFFEPEGRSKRILKTFGLFSFFEPRDQVGPSRV